jgi:O-antigen/teichoic acid export membrane protein
MATRQQFLLGLAWKTASQTTVFLLRFGVLLAWARLLEPREYGLAAMALVFAGVGYVVGDFGLGAALIQRTRLSELERSTAFWASLWFSGLLALAMLALAHPIARFYGDRAVAPLLAALAAGFVIRSLGSTHAALLQRELAFRVTELGTVIGSAVGAVAGIGAAVMDYGAWAIVTQQLTTATMTTAVLWLGSPWRPHMMFSRRELRSLSGFGANVLVARLALYGSRTVDNLLVGKFLGAAPLGAYALAYNLVVAPLTGVVDPVRAVLAPTLARLQSERERVADVWLRVLRALAAVVFPLMATLAIFAPEFVAVVLDERWSEATTVIRVLAGVAVLQVLVALNAIVLIALDRTRTLRTLGLWTLALSTLGFVAGLRWDIEGVATGYLVATGLIAPLYLLVTARTLGTGVSTVARALRGVVEATLGAAGASALVAWAIPGLGAAGSLLLGLGAAAPVYAVLLLLRANDVVEDVRLASRDVRAGLSRARRYSEASDGFE